MAVPDLSDLDDFDDLMLAGTPSGVEMGLTLSGIPFQKGGVTAALDHMTEVRMSLTSPAAR